MANDDTACCWVCLGPNEAGASLIQPCACPRYVHERCLARWQLQCAGRAEETNCRFCGETLPDWRPTLTPGHAAPSAVPLVSIHFNGVCYKLRIKPGPEGREQFRRTLARVTGVPALEGMQVTFQCKAPLEGQDLSLKGLDCFDAAIYCAAVSAAARASSKRSSTPAVGRDGATDRAATGRASSSSSPGRTARQEGQESTAGNALAGAAALTSRSGLPPASPRRASRTAAASLSSRLREALQRLMDRFSMGAIAPTMRMHPTPIVA